MNELAGILQQTKCLVYCNICFSGLYRSGEEHYLAQITLPFLESLCITDRTRFGSSAPSSGTPGLIDLITAPALQIFKCSPIYHRDLLVSFFQRSPKIRKLSLPYSLKDRPFSKMIRFLHCCSSLTELSLHPPSQSQAPNFQNRMLTHFCEHLSKRAILVLFVRACSTSISGENITFSLPTLQLFLNRKHGEPTIPDISPWKRVIINIRGMEETEEYQQMLDFVSQKKAQGLMWMHFPRDEDFPEYNYFDE